MSTYRNDIETKLRERGREREQKTPFAKSQTEECKEKHSHEPSKNIYGSWNYVPVQMTACPPLNAIQTNYHLSHMYTYTYMHSR